MTLEDKFRFATALTTLAPVLGGFLTYKRAGFPVRLIFWLLVYGLATDIIVGQDIASAGDFFYNLYSLAEPALLFLFFRKLSQLKFERLVIDLMIAADIVSWNINIFYLNNKPSEIMDPLHDSIFMAILALIAAYFLIRITERKNLKAWNEPVFWFLIGIFFFNFCTFFIMTFADDAISERFWWVFNMMNVICNTFYFTGFLLAYKSIKRSQVWQSPA
jgi:hypothetical protein